MIKTIKKAANAWKLAIVVYFDTIKFYVIASNRRLINQIKSYGNPVPLFSRFVSYPLSRNQVVQVNRFTSNRRPVDSVVNQGISLDPLFLLYAKEFFKFVQNGVPFLLGNDNEIFYTFQSEALGSNNAEISRELTPLKGWPNEWTLKFSDEKRYVL